MCSLSSIVSTGSSMAILVYTSIRYHHNCWNSTPGQQAVQRPIRADGLQELLQATHLPFFAGGRLCRIGAVAISRLSRPLIWGPILLRVLYRNPHLAIYLGSLGPSVVVLRVMACGRSQCLQLEPLPETLGPETLDPKGKPKAQDPSSSRAKQARYNRNEFMPLDAKTAPRA